VFSTKNVGTSIPVSATGYTLSGTDASNYAVVQPAPLAANISQAPLDVTGITAANKVYDATTAATLDGTATVAPLLSDVVTVSGTGLGVFSTKNVGTSIPVSATGYTLSGTDASNYAVVQPAPLAANITAAPLLIPPELVLNATTQSELNALWTQAGEQPETLTLSPTITGMVTIIDVFSLDADNGASVNITMGISSVGPTLQIVRGVTLP
jgi:hypothetical protein